MDIQGVSNGTSVWATPNHGELAGGDALTTQQKEIRQKNVQSSLSPAEDQKMRKACQDFEAFFLSYLTKQMRTTVPQGGVLQESRPQQIYRDMLDDSVADSVARSNKGIGLADMLYKNLRQEQGKKIYSQQQNTAHLQSKDTRQNVAVSHMQGNNGQVGSSPQVSVEK